MKTRSKKINEKIKTNDKWVCGVVVSHSIKKKKPEFDSSAYPYFLKNFNAFL